MDSRFREALRFEAIPVVCVSNNLPGDDSSDEVAISRPEGSQTDIGVVLPQESLYSERDVIIR